MKLTNHKKSNFYNLEDGASMHGTITMTVKEYLKVIDFLHKEYFKAEKKGNTYIRDSLSYMQFYLGKIQSKPSEYVSLGVCATKLLSDKYNLNAKNQNYAIKII